eukprot:2812009-Ditylum_brightwellii.AAC.1
MDSNDNPVAMPHNMYVDDNLIAGIRPIMKQVMSASIEALFIFISYPEPYKKRNAVSTKKFLTVQCSYEKKQLGIRLNTRALALGLMA